MSEWIDIESAPNQEFVIVSDKETDFVCSGFYIAGCEDWVLKIGNKGVVINKHSDEFALKYWMPLPSPPEEKK